MDWFLKTHKLSGDHSDPGIEPESFRSPVLADRFFTTSPTLEAAGYLYLYLYLDI